MATLREIRDRIKGVKNIIQITSAMKLVAAAKMKRAQDAITAARPYATKLENMLGYLAANVEEAVDPLLQVRDRVRKIGLVVITADRGLCGGFNSNLLRFAKNHIDTELAEQYPQAEIQIVPVGNRGIEYYLRRPDEFHVDETYQNVFTGLDFLTAQTISRTVTDAFLLERFDKVQLVYNEAVTAVRQQPVVRNFVPIVPNEEVLEESKKANTEYIVEPSLSDLLGSLLPKHLNMQIWRALLESNAAEHAARMLAMDNATRNATDLKTDLELNYNKARQAAITTEILEIVSGADALQG